MGDNFDNGLVKLTVNRLIVRKAVGYIPNIFVGSSLFNLKLLS